MLDYTNPVLNESLVARVVPRNGRGRRSNFVSRKNNVPMPAMIGSDSDTMRFDTVRYKAIFLLAVFASSFVVGFTFFATLTMPAQLVCGLFLIALVAASGILLFKLPETSSWMASVFVLLEGLAISALVHFFLPSLGEHVLNFVGIPFSVMLSILIISSRAMIDSDNNRTLVKVVGASIAVFFWYLFIAAAEYLFHVPITMPHELDIFSLLVVLLVLFVSSSCFVEDLDTASLCIECSAPKYMEWYCAFALLFSLPTYLVTVVSDS